jgi:diguanylate cyclase (GGDEF)-like protein/PAS domain S-box-containing protein
MDVLIRLLHLEDDPLDAELIKEKLKDDALCCDITWANSKQTFESALHEGVFDIVLTDFNLPDYDGMFALQYVREHRPDLPVIVISGRLGEEEAVECLKAGATDYILKQRMQRLGAAVRRALLEKAEQITRREAEEEIVRQHKFLRQVIDLDRNFIFAKNYAGQFTLVNQSLAEAYGTSVNSLLGKTDADFNHNAEEVEFFNNHDRFVIDTLQEVFIPEEKITDAAGKIRWLQTVRRPIISENANANMMLGISVDITERKKQELRLARLNRMHSMLSSINSAITRIKDRNELLQEACRIAIDEGEFTLAWCGFVDNQNQVLIPLVYSGDQRGILNGLRISLDEDHSELGFALNDGIDLKTPMSVNLKESSIVHDLGWGPRRENLLLQNGFQSLASFPIIIDEQFAGLMVMYSEDADIFDPDEMELLTTLADDISFALNYQEKQAALNYATLFDLLTGLPNRQLFLERAEFDIQSNANTNSFLALLLIDIRHFGMINDSFGKSKGDQLLQMIAQRLSTEQPTNIARIGGNCFAIAISGLHNDAEFAHTLQTYLVEPFTTSFLIGDQELNVTIRSGISVFPTDGRAVEALITNAEVALKKAKLSSTEYMFYTSDMNARVTEQLLMESQLRKAIIEKQFVMHYQPKHTASSGDLVGLEALIRWVSPERGLVPPLEFIPILEDSGMIMEVGKWLTRQAATDYLKWQKLGLNPPPIAVNVSALQLKDPDFVDVIRSSVWGHIDDNDITNNNQESAAIDLEITESVLMENIDSLIPRLQELKDAGFHISIDDFGTGYSSFSYLSKIPLGTIKIDRSFITEITTSADQRTIVSTIILLAHALKLKVIAEGVETNEQRAQLILMGCDELQGYLLGKPMPSSDVESVLAKLICNVLIKRDTS